VWEYELWVGAPSSGGKNVYLLSGHDGAVKAVVPIPEFGNGVAFYGGAVDADGNFWTHEKGQCNEQGCPRLAYVSYETLEHKTWEIAHYTTEEGDERSPGYGITVDSAGHVWMCSHGVGRFDPATETWVTATTGGGNGGCMDDGTGRLWQAGNGPRAIDIWTLEAVATGSMPHSSQGISIDHEGRIWGTSYGSEVSRYDPATGEVQTYDPGLNHYTYCDMTGVALLNAGSIPVDPAG
jgi:sugar lactone lactonase YvrE